MIDSKKLSSFRLTTSPVAPEFNYLQEQYGPFVAYNWLLQFGWSSGGNVGAEMSAAWGDAMKNEVIGVFEGGQPAQGVFGQSVIISGAQAKKKGGQYAIKKLGSTQWIPFSTTP